jgi:peptidoglycan L-alanyl-D-glutamate endopeptidase CwlK
MNTVFFDSFAIDVNAGASVMSQITPDLVARMFPSAPRANLERYLPLIRRALAERGLVDKMMVVMALATIRVETARFDPVSEAPSALNTQSPGPPFNKYDWRQDLGNQGPPDGAMFKGRGFIQLTGRKNYTYYGALLGHNLISNPDLANSPQPAAQILAAYLKENESPIRSALAMGDLGAARRIVNGGSNGLDRFMSAFMAGDQLIADYNSILALSTERPKRRENRKVKALSFSASESKSLKSREKKRDDTDDRKTKKKNDDIADGEERKKNDDTDDRKTKKKNDGAADGEDGKKKDDADDGKTRKKKDDIADGEDRKKRGAGTDGKSKGFFLFRPFRMLRALSLR